MSSKLDETNKNNIILNATCIYLFCVWFLVWTCQTFDSDLHFLGQNVSSADRYVLPLSEANVCAIWLYVEL